MAKISNSDIDYISRLEALLDLSHILTQESDFKHMLQIITGKARTLFSADFALLMMINPQTHNTLKTVFAGREESTADQQHAINSSISGWVIKYRRTLLSRDIRQDSRFKNGLLRKCMYRSVLCSPLYAEGMIIGTLLLARSNQSTYDDQDMVMADHFSGIAAPFLRNVEKLKEYFDHKISDQILIEKYKPLGLIGKCHKFIELLQAIEIAAGSDIRVIIEGESGTGKELVARAIHRISQRSQQKLIAMDCGAIPEHLIESTLFGHTKGAFTGASEHRTGLIQEADQGTLFLDEISNIPLMLQAKLLRFLQEGEFRPVGGNKLIRVNVRIISASSRPLYQLVEQNRFREDLFYRLYVLPIKIPSLGDRKEDIPVLAQYFLLKFAQQHHKKLKHLHEGIIEYLKQNKWSGNIRELENFIERLVALAAPENEILDHEALPATLRKELEIERPKQRKTDLPLFTALADHEREIIRKALSENNWNQARTARLLQISEASIRYKINKLGIKKPGG